MLQGAGHPCHRLIRLSIGGMELGDLAVGQVRELTAEKFFQDLGLKA